MSPAIAKFNKKLMSFLDSSPSAFHATSVMEKTLKKEGYLQLLERDSWRLKKGGRYYITRGGSAIIAFQLAADWKEFDGFNMIGAHTDSPALKIRSNPVKMKSGHGQLGVEVYGGAILSSWFDRDLSIAGRVSYLTNGKIKHQLIDFGRPVATLPNVAIHLNPKVNSGQAVQTHKELSPILLQGEKGFDWDKMITQELKRTYKSSLKVERILDYDLLFYDDAKAASVGVNGEFIASGRLDNLASCFVGMEALLTTPKKSSSLLVCSDHEEVGSSSTTGAAGTFLKSILQRIYGSQESFARGVSRSVMISCDNAHGLHPNFSEKYEESSAPIINQGPVLKLNAKQRYATSAESSAILELVAQKAQVPLQRYVSRNDVPCGSTIGPITATTLGMRTMDIGIPSLAMHSIRELIGSRDGHLMFKLLKEFLKATHL
jgi:aspartyl aminopeptidase